MTTATIDIQIFDDGSSIVMLSPLTERATAWIKSNVSLDGFQPWWPDRVVVERNRLRPVLQGMSLAGLVFA